jgi:hypothetical protein
MQILHSAKTNQQNHMKITRPYQPITEIDEMKKILLSSLLLAATATSAHAGSCGMGVVTDIRVGGNNNQNFQIKIDYSEGKASHSDVFQDGWIRYLGSLPAARLQYIKNLAIISFQSGKTVEAYSHNNACTEATELTLHSN